MLANPLPLTSELNLISAARFGLISLMLAFISLMRSLKGAARLSSVKFKLPPLSEIFFALHAKLVPFFVDLLGAAWAGFAACFACAAGFISEVKFKRLSLFSEIFAAGEPRAILFSVREFGLSAICATFSDAREKILSPPELNAKPLPDSPASSEKAFESFSCPCVASSPAMEPAINSVAYLLKTPKFGAFRLKLTPTLSGAMLALPSALAVISPVIRLALIPKGSAKFELSPLSVALKSLISCTLFLTIKLSPILACAPITEASPILNFKVGLLEGFLQSEFAPPAVEFASAWLAALELAVFLKLAGFLEIALKIARSFMLFAPPASTSELKNGAFSKILSTPRSRSATSNLIPCTPKLSNPLKIPFLFAILEFEILANFRLAPF